MKKILFWLISLVFVQIINAQVSVSIQPGINGKDAHIDNLNTATNYANYPLVNAGYNTVGGTPTLSRNFLQFDLSAVPTGAHIISAYLSLYHAPGANSSNNSGNAEILALVQSPWVQDSITWNYQPPFSNTDTIQIGATVTDTDSKVNIDITRFAQFWASNPNANFGMALLLSNEQSAGLGNFQIYASCYDADSTLRPKLVITYQTSCPAMSVLQPGINGKDAHIDNLNTTTNYGNYPLVNAGYNTVGGTPTLSRDFIQFDLSAIPPTATVDTAYLSLYHDPAYNSANTSGDTEMLALVQQPWVQDSITWAYQPLFSTTDTIITGPTLTGTDSKININLTKFAQYWVNHPNLNFGMAMLLANEQGTGLGNFQIYGSCYDADSAFWPKLVVDWTYCPTGIKNLHEANADYDLYPNPVNEILNIGTDLNVAVDIALFDVTGQKIMTALQVKSINTVLLQPGVYLLQITDGEKTAVKKFIKN